MLHTSVPSEREGLRRKEIDGRRGGKQRYTHLQHPHPHIYICRIFRSKKQSFLIRRGQRTKKKMLLLSLTFLMWKCGRKVQESLCFYVWVCRQEGVTKQNKKLSLRNKWKKPTLGEYIQFLVAPPFGSGVSIYSQGRKERGKRRGEKRRERVLPLLPPPLTKGLPSLIYQDLLFPSKKSLPLQEPLLFFAKNFPPKSIIFIIII